MRRSRTRVNSDRRQAHAIGLALALVWASTLLVASPAAAAKGDNAAREQLRFGVEMARRGLWNEALFRFEQLRKTMPTDSKVLNNLAVAYEAVGRFDDADAAYGEALRVDPSNRDIRKNVTRFREFLQSFRVKKPESGGSIPAEPGVPPSSPPSEPPPPPPSPDASR